MIYDANELPEAYEHDGKTYPMHTDFREWIRYESLISNQDVPERLKSVMAVRLIFTDANLPEDLFSALEYIEWFYRGGHDAAEDSSGNGEIALESRRVYDLEYDSDYIYAAFLEQYGIDLTDIPYLHWWKFRALFLGLHDCRLTEIMGYRGAEISDDLPDSRRAFLLDMQEFYELPVSLTEQRRINEAKKFLEG